MNELIDKIKELPNGMQIIDAARKWGREAFEGKNGMDNESFRLALELTKYHALDILEQRNIKNQLTLKLK